MNRQAAKYAKNAKIRGHRPEPTPELDQLAYDVIGAAIEVHRQLGPGFRELIYEQATVIELTQRGIAFRQQGELRPVHTAQVISYLRAGAFQLGLLFNFNVHALRDGIQRIICSG